MISHYAIRNASSRMRMSTIAVRAEGWIESIRFFTKFILNCDEHL